MRRNNWISIEDFNKKYNLHPSNIHVAINHGSIPRSVVRKLPNHTRLFVNESWFVRRKEFMRKVQMYIQDMYYFHYYDDFTDMDMCAMFGVNHKFLNDTLWRTDTTSIMKVWMSQSFWKTWRYMRMVERVCYKRYNPEFNLSKELDKRIAA